MTTRGHIGSIVLGLLVFISIGFSTAAADAATREWVGPAGGTWSMGASWNPAGPPVDGDDLVFSTAGSDSSLNDLGGPVTLRSLRFEVPHTLQAGTAFSVETGIEVLTNASIESAITLLANAAISGSATLTINGRIAGASDFSITGVTVAVSNPNNTLTGTMTINTGGSFVVNAIGALGSGTPPTVGAHLAGGTLKINVANSTTGVNRLTGNGTLDLGNHSPGGFFNVWVATENEFTGNITGFNSVFVKAGAGKLTLGGATSYTGMAYHTDGELVIAHPQALNNSTTNVFNNSTLTYDVSSSRTMPLSLSGTGLNGAGALRLRGGSVTQGEMMSVSNGPTTIAVAAPHQLSLQGPLQGNGQTLNVIGGGTMALNNVINTLPAFVIGDGAGPGPTLRAGASGAFGFSTATINAGATLDLGGFNTSLTNITGTGRIDTGGAAEAIVGGDFAGTFHGVGTITTFPTTTATLAGTHTLSGEYRTDSLLVVRGTIPATVHATGDRVTLEPGSATGPLKFTPLSNSDELIVGDPINPGGATTGALTIGGGTFKPMLSGTAPRVTVNGSVSLNGALDLSYAGPIPQAVLTLIANDGDDPIQGSFYNALDASQVVINGVKYVVDYHGGDGNDLTLMPPIETYHLSEGATGPFFDTDLLIANPWDWEMNVEVTFLPELAAPITQQYILAPRSRRTIHVDEIDGLESAAFSTIVKPDAAYSIAVERTMRWDATGYGGHTEKATAGPATTWYFAEGSEGFFRTFLLLANPQTTANVAHVTWLREGGAGPIERTYDLLPSSRKTISAIDDPELVNQAFGIRVTFDQPGVAERAMYFGGPPVFKGGHESAGVTEPSTTWLLAEGATGDGFDTFILVANPGAEDADVTFTFLPAEGQPAALTRQVKANSRITVNPEAEDLDIPLGPVGTQITSTKPVIAERAQYWPLGPVQWTEAHNSFGVTEASRYWLLAEGRVGGAEEYQTYILLANPGDTAASVDLTYLADGQARVPSSRTVAVGPKQRLNVPVPPRIPNEFETFGTFILSDQPIVVERAMYWNVGGEVWAAGTNATATRVRTP